MVGRMSPPPTKDVHVLIPGIYEYVASHSKGKLRLQLEA